MRIAGQGRTFKKMRDIRECLSTDGNENERGGV